MIWRHDKIKNPKSLRAVIVCLALIFSAFLALEGLASRTSNRGEGAEDGKEYQSTSVPLTARTAATWILLQETKIEPLPDQTPLGEILNAVKASTRHESPKLNFILDRQDMHFNDAILKSRIDKPVVTLPKVSLQSYLTLILDPLGLVHTVSENVILISSPKDDFPNPREVAASEARTWLLLNETVSLSIPDEMPLEQVIGVIQKAAMGKSKNARGLVVHAEPKDVVLANEKANSLLKMELVS